jgi:hypothetical protein
MQEQLGQQPVAPAELVASASAPPSSGPAEPVDDAHKMDVDNPAAPSVAPSGAAQAPMVVDAPADETKTDGSNGGEKMPILFFRCFRCKRGVHVRRYAPPARLSIAH